MKQQKVIPITHEKLKNLFISRNFLSGIKKATKIGFERYTESHFSFWYNIFSNKVKYFSPNLITHDLPFSTAFELSDKNYEEIDNQKLVPLIHYHCHVDPYASPSEKDLIYHFDSRKQHNFLQTNKSSLQSVENCHLDCIGAIREGGRFHDVLIFQNTSKNMDSLKGKIVYEQLSEKLRRRKDDNILVSEALNDLTNWNAHLLTYERKNKYQKYQISEHQLAGLEKFAYVPVLNPKELEIEEKLMVPFKVQLLY